MEHKQESQSAAENKDGAEIKKTGARRSVVGRRTMLQAAKSRVRISMTSLDF
jgi:hypothetical protein